MAVWRKWEVVFVDDRGERHYADFGTKSRAISFAKALARHGVKDIICCKDGLKSQVAYQIKPNQEQPQ